MSYSSEEIEAIVKRILDKTHTESDLNTLRHIMLINGDKNTLQIGKTNIDIRKARDITIQVADCIYQGDTAVAIQQAVHESVLKGLSEGLKGLSASDFPGEYSLKESIIYRHITGVNEYSTLSFLEEIMPNKLTTILGINHTPIIYTDNPVFKSLENFAVGTGNEFLISYKYHPKTNFYISAALNNNGYTKTISHGAGGLSENNTTENFTQNNKDFENDTLDYKLDELGFNFPHISASFQTSVEDAEWTSIYESEGTNIGRILQYPKLAAVKTCKLGVPFYLKVDETWIKRILKANPETRGFILFLYQYIKSLKHSFFGECYGRIVEYIPPTPYLRFLDIKNIQNRAIKIQALNLNVVENGEDKLTEVSSQERRHLFSSSTQVTQPINIILPPQHHLLIPTEFGFDTKNHQKPFSYVSENNPIGSVSFFKDTLYVSKNPDEDDSLFKNFTDVLGRKQIDWDTLYGTTPELMNTLITDTINLSPDFLAKTKPLKDFLNSHPKRFAVGSLMEVVSLQIDGKEIKIDSPDDTPKFSMSIHFNVGSCPYLMVYNTKKGYWKELGTVLYGRKHKSLQSDEIYKLGEDISKIRIEERESEITYIQSLSIIYTDSQTDTKREIMLSLSGLASQEEGYFVLHEGQSIEIDLETLISADALDIKLKINGYYEILPDSNISRD
ncbi:hypothetical protein [Brasilonema bromeliae]|uniref:Effector-associated domain-containing protein n=1 Tax=Brasilonema bromeliae SPC951 TaxID=385972 RepID=A0ABX1PBA4_9CYAN|nr:hypothetical protein [Brasilonema bromeliae]NMG21666.1 hypothetical protein [Brasilonema bromeliae SPC951]